MNVVTAQALAPSSPDFTTASTTYVDHLISGGGSAVSVSITKGAGTNLIVDLNIESFAFNTGANLVFFAVNDGTTDYDVCKAAPSTTTTNGAHGAKMITGLAAGTYTIKVRVKVSANTYQLASNNLGYISLTVSEVDP